MFWLLLFLSIFVLLLILIIFTKLTILFHYYHYNDNDDLKIEFRIWFGLIKYKIKVPLIKIDDDSPSVVVKSHSHMGDASGQSQESKGTQITKENVMTYFEKTRDFMHKVIHLNVIIRKFFLKVTIKKFEWQTFIGVGDAANTAIVTGALWTIKGSIAGILSNYLSLKAVPELAITPHFQASVIQTRIICIFQFRIGQAILAGLKLIKFWKGGKTLFKNKTNFSNEKMRSI